MTEQVTDEVIARAMRMANDHYNVHGPERTGQRWGRLSWHALGPTERRRWIRMALGEGEQPKPTQGRLNGAGLFGGG